MLVLETLCWTIFRWLMWTTYRCRLWFSAVQDRSVWFEILGAIQPKLFNLRVDTKNVNVARMAITALGLAKTWCQMCPFPSVAIAQFVNPHPFLSRREGFFCFSPSCQSILVIPRPNWFEPYGRTQLVRGVLRPWTKFSQPMQRCMFFQSSGSEWFWNCAVWWSTFWIFWSTMHPTTTSFFQKEIQTHIYGINGAPDCMGWNPKVDGFWNRSMWLICAHCHHWMVEFIGGDNRFGMRFSDCGFACQTGRMAFSSRDSRIDEIVAMDEHKCAFE